jgi:hypothetical protein
MVFHNTTASIKSVFGVLHYLTLQTSSKYKADLTLLSKYRLPSATP